jgi:bla regulator protein BlaR1
MTGNFPELIVRLALASSAAIVLMLLLRRPLRARFGAGVAYQAWLIVPMMLAVALLPPLRGVPQAVADLTALPAAALVPGSAPQVSSGWAVWLLLAWGAGALALASRFVDEHRRFVRRLGPLRLDGAVHVAAQGTDGPVLLGLWRPKLVLPSDFTRRYGAGEQALILAHENAHASRRDPFANACFTVLQCCFWFNPLVHAAAPRFRFDQELACDATVMAAHPGTAQAYASAMLKAQTDEASAPAICHWQSIHPLKERIMNLQQFPLSPSRRQAGRLVLAALLLAGGGATLAARADPAASDKAARYDVNMTLTALGSTSKPRLHVRDGEMFKIGKGNDQSQWDGEFVLSAKADGKIYVTSKLTHNKLPMGEQAMLMDLGQTATLNVSSDDGKASFKLDMLVTALAAAPAK